MWHIAAPQVVFDVNQNLAKAGSTASGAHFDSFTYRLLEIPNV
jgi:hypothetical protein